MAGVTIRTLHLYDKIGLLKPRMRTSSNYRCYGESEMLRLQQILFYKELDFSLKDIKQMLAHPDFDVIKALESHRAAITERSNRLDILLQTIDHTVNHLKNKIRMENYEKLYEGIAKEEAKAWRNEAVEKWGEAAVSRSEDSLLNLSSTDLEQLKVDQKDVAAQLKFKFLAGESAEGYLVQEEMARHYQNIRGFWALKDGDHLSAAQYKGLAELYVTDERYINENGKPDRAFATFLRNGMIRFADNQLK